jgi:hypothetical protein
MCDQTAYDATIPNVERTRACGRLIYDSTIHTATYIISSYPWNSRHTIFCTSDAGWVYQQPFPSYEFPPLPPLGTAPP